MNRISSLRKFRRTAGLVLVAAVLEMTGAARVWSQQQQGPGLPIPRLHFVTPNGGKAGTTFEMALSGEDLDTAEGLLFDAPGIAAELVSAPPTPTMKRGNQKGAVITARFKVTVSADTPPGIHDVRLVSKWGVSNPRAFVVGDLQEVDEKEPNNDVDQAQRVPLNCSITGTITTPTDVDYYSFEGKKGQRVVVSCLASSIDSKLQPQIQLFTKANAPLASNRDYQGTDALVDAVLPADGEYNVRVVSFTYTQGGPDYFYRLTISTAPWIDAVFPPMIEPGKEAKVTVYGRNLPGGVPDPSAVLGGSVLEKATVTVKAPAGAAEQRLAYSGHVSPIMASTDGFEFRLKNAAGTSNPYLLTFAHAPVVLDNGANDTPDTAQQVMLPCEIAGRIEKLRDRDWYRFAVKKGETYSIEAYGDRIGSAIDLYFTVRREKSKAVQEFDDNPEVLHPLQFYSRTEDPLRYKLTAPDDGTYLLQVSSREADTLAGPRSLYRVRITPEKPDFRLFVLPPSTHSSDAVLLQKGTSQAYSVLLSRQDGFAGEVALSADGLPPGVTCPPVTLGPGAKQGALVLTAEPGAAPWTGTFTVKGKAMIDGRAVEVEARPADITWSVNQNQNIPTVARLSRTLVVAVRDGAPFHLEAKADKAEARVGEKVRVTVKLKRVAGDFKGPVQVTLVNPLPNQQVTFNNNQPLTLNPGKDEGTATLDLRNQLPPGTYSFVLRATGQVPYSRDPQGKQKGTATVQVAALPVTVTVNAK